MTVECWRCGAEGPALALPSHPDGGATICHACWKRIYEPGDGCPECTGGSGSWAECQEAAVAWERRLSRTARVEVLSLANAASKGMVDLD